MTYRYTLTHMGTDQVIKPCNRPQLSSNRQTQDEGQYFWKKSLGEVSVCRVKDAAGYDFILAIENGADRCEAVTITLEQHRNGGWTTRYIGEFSMNDCDFNLENCTLNFKSTEANIYWCIEKNWDKKVNILDGGTSITTFPTLSASPAFPNGRTFSSVLGTLVTQACSEITMVKSNFFAINQDGTGGAASEFEPDGLNHWDQMTIHQITDVKYWSSGSPATIGNMTLKTFLADLKKIFDIRWKVEGTVFRIEHISWFTAGGTNDLTAVRGYNLYSYKKEVLAGVQKYMFANGVQNDVDFVGLDIEYAGPCVRSEIEQFTCEYIATDYEYVLANPDTVPNDGFILFCNLVIGSDYRVVDSEAELTNTTKSNAALSWATLHQYFHQHNRNLITGTMNGDSQTFASSKRIKKQRIQVVDCFFDVVDEYLCETLLGTGEVEEMDRDLDSGNTTIQLLI